MNFTYDAAMLKKCRQALDDVLTDIRFLNCKAVSALEVAEHILARAAEGERSQEKLTNSALGLLISHAA